MFLAKLFCLLVGLVLCTPKAKAQSPEALAQLYTAVSEMSDCSQTALITAVNSSECSLDDGECLCNSQHLRKDLELFLMVSCTIKEALQVQNLTSIACNEPIRDRRLEYTTVSTTLACISGMLVIQRFAFKIFSKLPLCADDWTTLVTFFLGLPTTVMNVHAVTPAGLGTDIWTLRYDQIYDFGKYFLILEVNYFVEVAMVKLAMLFFFLRIFPDRKVRNLLWGTVVFNCVFGVVFTFMGIFQCHPVSYFWTRWDQEHDGTCMNINHLAWANAAISIFLDLWMLAIPLWQLRHLKLDWKKKVGVAMMFCVATFETVVSFLRLRSLITFKDHQENPTWDYLEVSLWSVVEINVGLICVCLPTMRLMLVKIFPKLASQTREYYTGSFLSGRPSTLWPLRASKPASPSTQMQERYRISNPIRVCEEGQGPPTSLVAAKNNNMAIIYEKTFKVEFDDDNGATFHHVDHRVKRSMSTVSTAWSYDKPF